MLTLIAITFVVAYIAIALEQPIKINKSATALVAAGLMWILYASAAVPGKEEVARQLIDKLGETAQVVFFLIGAMTIVEVIDVHGGFEVITKRIKTSKISSLLWIIAFVTFFLSAVLDNMTTAIVMVSLMKKILRKHGDRLTFAGIIVIAANAGGAWTPIGDVTTTMLWIGGQITTVNIIQKLFGASMVNLLVSVGIASAFMRGPVEAPEKLANSSKQGSTADFEKNFMFFMGLGALMAVPAIKALTGLPPFLGIMFALGLLWVAGEILHRKKSDAEKEHLTIAKALKRIDMPSVVFFIGILLAVATISATGQLSAFAVWLGHHIGSQTVLVLTIGLVSAVVDNIPLVAATMGMYPLAHYPPDSFLWEFLAYCAGTGGSILVIGSAAGVAAMGLEKIHFFWYVKRISLLALLGYLGGAAIYIAQSRLLLL